MPMPCHLELEGEKQGKIEGSCEMSGRTGTILVYELHHAIAMPTSPADGTPTHKRSHGAFTIIKMIDASSPKIFQAICTGERMKTVVLKYYRITKQGTEEHYYTTRLENATIVNYQPAMPNTLISSNNNLGHMEAVSFKYEKIRVTWEATGIEAEDSWKSPV